MAKNNFKTIEKVKPFRLTKLGHLRPFDSKIFNFSDQHLAIEHAEKSGPATEGETFTLIPVFEYPVQEEPAQED